MNKLLIILMLVSFPTYKPMAQTDSLILEQLEKSFLLKSKFEFGVTLWGDTNSILMTNTNIHDDEFVIVIHPESSKLSFDLSDIHLSSQKLAVYLKSNQKLYFISGYDQLDLTSFFSAINKTMERGKILSKFTEVFDNHDLLFFDAYFNSIEKYQKLRDKKVNRVMRRLSIKKHDDSVILHSVQE